MIKKISQTATICSSLQIPTMDINKFTIFTYEMSMQI